VHVGQLEIAAAVRNQLAGRQAGDEVDEAARVGIAADGRTQRRAVGIEQRTAGHLDGLQRLRAIVEVERGERQHERMHGLGRPVRGAWIQQRELAGRMTQPRGNLRLVLLQAFGIDAMAALLLVLQHRQRQRHHRQRKQREQAAEQHAQPQRHAPRQAPTRHRGALENRKPRIGTFSMPSKPGSISRKASRMVLTCLRTLSRLRPLLMTW
jgi:hypothetical protein